MPQITRLILWSSFIFVPRIFAVSGFDKTSSGINERTEDFGGISKEEQEQIGNLNSKLQQQLNTFNVGRTSSGEDSVDGSNNRFSGSIEMHDDFSGVTYHPGAASGLEGPMDNVATQGKNGSEKERQEALKENRNNAGRCKDGFIDGVTLSGGGKALCKNLSAVLVDMGPAHPHGDDPEENEQHRVYQMTDEAQKVSKKSGADYAQQVIADATSKTFDDEAQQASQAVGANRTLAVNADGTVDVTVTKNGKSVTAQRNPELDLLRSEAAWLEQQKQEYAERAWKTLRAARLAGTDTERYYQKDQIKEFNSLVSNTMGQKDQDQQIAQRVAEQGTYSGSKFCYDGSGDAKPKGENPCPNAPTSKQTDAQKDALAQKLIEEAEKKGNSLDKNTADRMAESIGSSGEVILKDLISMVPSQEVPTLYDQARENATDDEKKEISENLQKIQPCLEQNKWCWGADEKYNLPPDAKLYSEIQGGDPAGTASGDVRELMYSNIAAANNAPMAERLSRISNSDFNANTDAATSATVFTEFKKQYDENMQAYQAALEANANYEKNGKAFGADGSVSVGYKNKFKGDAWDANTKSFNQLFGRDPSRDATSIAGTGRGNTGYRGSIEFNRENASKGTPDRSSGSSRPNNNPPSAPSNYRPGSMAPGSVMSPI